MHIQLTPMTIGEVFEGFQELDNDGGVFAYNGKLTVRPAYQREFVYNDAEQAAVMTTVSRDFPLNVMYWVKIVNPEDPTDVSYEVLDGQQRTISIGRYLQDGFAIDYRGNKEQYFSNLTPDQKQQILDHKLQIYVCEGTPSEVLGWFRIINIAGKPLTEQELRNASYVGPWLSDAKRKFSKREAPALNDGIGKGMVSGNPMRQDILERALMWFIDGHDEYGSIENYMARHQYDKNAQELWMYWSTVMSWARTLFDFAQEPESHMQLRNDWGELYNTWHERTAADPQMYNPEALHEEIVKLVDDPDVTKNSGIIPYLLSERTSNDERYLSIRSFDKKDCERKYLEQHGECAKCGKPFEIKQMQGDHVIPWSQGGKSVYDNLQMLCKECNARKSNK